MSRAFEARKRRPRPRFFPSFTSDPPRRRRRRHRATVSRRRRSLRTADEGGDRRLARDTGRRVAGDVASSSRFFPRTKNPLDSILSLAKLLCLSLYVPELDRCTEILIQFGTSFGVAGQAAERREGEKGSDGAKQLVAGPPSPIFRTDGTAEKKNAACGERGAARWVRASRTADPRSAERVTGTCHATRCQFRLDFASRRNVNGEIRDVVRLR